MENTQKANIFACIFRTILTGKVKTIQIAPVICKCTHCKKEIDPNSLYLRFTGEYLHTVCFIEYMQKMRILDVIMPQKKRR